MTVRSRFPLLMLGGVLALPSACGDRDAPTEVAMQPTASAIDHSMHGGMASIGATAQPTFTVRAPLGDFNIQQLPDFMIQSRKRADIVMQRVVFQPGAGIWHTHPGPSFVYVEEGRIKLERVVAPNRCTSTPVFAPGQVYFEIANQVHRAVVTSDIPAVLVVTRFNIPVGGAITIPAADPGCQ